MLHIGAGPINLPGFINIDHQDSHNPDMVMDCTELDNHFEKDSVDSIYSCHMLEHLSFPGGCVQFLQKSYHVLKPGGTLRLVVPDAMKVAKKYVAGEDLKDIYDGNFWTYKDLPVTRLLWFFRGWDHTFVPDEELLRELCKDGGFSDIKVMPFSKSDIPELCNIDRFASESIVIQCQK